MISVDVMLFRIDGEDRVMAGSWMGENSRERRKIWLNVDVRRGHCVDE